MMAGMSTIVAAMEAMGKDTVIAVGIIGAIAAYLYYEWTLRRPDK